MSSKIRVGIIGTGGWARYGHIPALQSLEGFEITALAVRNKQKVEKYAAQFGISQAYGSPEELLNNPDVDLVVVLAPTLNMLASQKRLLQQVRTANGLFPRRHQNQRRFWHWRVRRVLSISSVCNVASRLALVTGTT